MELKVTRANPSSQSMALGPAVASSPGNLLQMQILSPLPRLSNWKLGAEPKICVLTRLLDDLMHTDV